MPIQPKQFSTQDELISNPKETPKIKEEVIELEKMLSEKKKELTKNEESEKHNKELIKEVIRKKIEIPKIQKTTPLTNQKIIVKKVKELKKEKEERQIKLLTSLAFEKGIIHATEVAKKLDNAFILDEFHDALVDKFYNYLVEQGKLKQV